jgi:hypothetical protein
MSGVAHVEILAINILSLVKSLSPDFLRKKIQLLDIVSTSPSIFGGPTEFLLDLIC